MLILVASMAGPVYLLLDSRLMSSYFSPLGSLWCKLGHMATLKAHFDGKALIPDEPVDLPMITPWKSR